MSGWFWITIILTSPFIFVLLIVIIAAVVHLIETFLNLFKKKNK